MSSIKPKAFICDLDGTLCDTSGRQHYMVGKHKDWNGFYREIPYDPIHEWCGELVFALYFRGYHPIFCSGRPDTYFDITMTWLVEKIGEENMRMIRPSLFMRKQGDYRKDSIVKRELYQMYIEPKYEIMLCIDDRPSVCRMWRSTGLTVLQCNDKEF